MVCSESNQRYSIRANVVLLTDFNPVVPKNGVGGGRVKEEMRQTVVEQVGLAGEAFFLGGSCLGDDFAR